MQWTITEKISKEGDECIIDKDYNPDNAMMAILTDKVGCNLPWSRVQLSRLKVCNDPKHFEKYLNKAVEFQNEISKVSKKCTFSSWNALPFEETIYSENNTTFLYASLFSDSGKVRRLCMKSFKIS